jgi:Domain of unknown function (DUF1707)
VTTGPGDDTAAAGASRGLFRASHADREHVIDMLKSAFVQGCLTKAEFDMRVGQTFASRTYADLAALTADVPACLTEAQPLGRRAQVQGRPPMSDVAKICALTFLAVAALVASVFSGKFVVFLLVTVIDFTALLLVGAQMLDSRHHQSSRGQLPQRPAHRGQALEGKQDRGIGRDLILAEVCSEARAGHVPDPGATRRTCWSLAIGQDCRRTANLQVSG